MTISFVIGPNDNTACLSPVVNLLLLGVPGTILCPFIIIIFPHIFLYYRINQSRLTASANNSNSYSKQCNCLAYPCNGPKQVGTMGECLNQLRLT